LIQDGLGKRRKLGNSGNSLINLGDWSKPADTLIKKISAAIGGLSKPFQIRRVAQAEADADKIRAAARIEITDLEHRAMSRMFAEEAKKQDNIESITLKALPDIGPESPTANVEDDWIANFFDKCRLISDEQMQGLWARILAGEANSPGRFSKRTVNLVGSLDKSDATLFSRLCGFVFMIGNATAPLIFDLTSRIYNEVGIDFRTLNHLESSGLIHLNGVGDYLRTGYGQKDYVYYFASPILIEFPKPKDNTLNIGHVILTTAGEELAPLSGAQRRKGFVDFVKEHWKRFGITTDPKPEQQTPQAMSSSENAPP
jgi:uncharacterized protein DUF2806